MESLATLERLLGGTDPDACADRILARHGITRPEPGAPDDDPRTWVWWLVRMASQTHRHLARPAPSDPALVARLSELLRERPGVDGDYAQLHVDAESTVRRASVARNRLAITNGRALAAGDDDAVTLALVLLGVTDVCAVDVDERLLAYLVDTARTLGARIDARQVDLLSDEAPGDMRGAFAVSITDPPRSRDDSLDFLRFCAACTCSGGSVLWADHPDWNYEHDEVALALPSLGLEIIDTKERWHRYPLVEAWIPDPIPIGRALGIDPEWLDALARVTSGFSSLYVLARR